MKIIGKRCRGQLELSCSKHEPMFVGSWHVDGSRPCLDDEHLAQDDEQRDEVHGNGVDEAIDSARLQNFT